MKNNRRNFCAAALISLSFGLALNPAFAQGQYYSQSQSTLSGDYNANRNVDPRLLGAVQPGMPPVITESEQGLKEIRDTIGKIKRVLSEVVHEVTRVQVFVYPTPVDMDDTWMDPTLTSDYYYPMQPVQAGGPQNGQPLPARKKWMDYYASQLSQLMPLLNNDANALVLPDQGQGPSPITAQMGVMKDTVKQIQNDYGQLRTAMQGPNYDNQYIARLAGAVRDDVCGIDVVRKHMLRIVQSDRKQSSKTF